jgi:hypothetical protein
MPGKSDPFTTRVEPVSPPLLAADKRSVMVEAPGTAPGSATLMPSRVYRHSQQAGPTHIGCLAMGIEGVIR